MWESVMAYSQKIYIIMQYQQNELWLFTVTLRDKLSFLKRFLLIAVPLGAGRFGEK